MKKQTKKSLLSDLQIFKNIKKDINKSISVKPRKGKDVHDQVNKRNRDRLEAKRLSTQMAYSFFEQQPEWHTYFYLSYLLQKNATQLFDKDIKHALKENAKKENTLHLLLLKELELERLVVQASLNKTDATKLLQLLNDTDQLLKTLQHNNAFRKQSYQAFLWSTGMVSTPDLKNEPPQNTWQKIYFLRKHTYLSTSIDEKIICLKEIFEISQQNNSSAFKRDQAAASANLSTYYMLKGDFEASHQYYNIAINLRKYLRSSNLQSLQYNYISANLRNNNLQRAYEALNQSEITTHNNPSLQFKFILLKCMCYLFHHKAKEIKKILPDKPYKKDALDQAYYYIIWGIYFFHQNKPETCEQMLDTSKRILKKKPLEKAIPKFIDMIKLYNELNLTYTSKVVRKKMLQQINNIDLSKYASGNILPLLWFKHFLLSKHDL